MSTQPTTSTPYAHVFGLPCSAITKRDPATGQPTAAIRGRIFGFDPKPYQRAPGDYLVVHFGSVLGTAAFPVADVSLIEEDGSEEGSE